MTWFTNCLRTTVFLAIVAQPLSAGRGEEPDDKQTAARKQRLMHLERRLAEFQVFKLDQPDQPLKTTQEPLLRYSNPVRNFFSDGATFLWLDGKRPAAAAAVSIRGTGRVWREFTSLSSAPLRCLREGRAVWTPQSGNLVGEPLPDPPRPSSSPKLRLTQMRGLARRFSVVMQESEAKPDEIKTLRLLTQPIYRWSDEEAGVVDGAFFAFCETTDPEAFLMLELVRPEGEAEPAWRFTLARMTSHPLVYRFDERKIVSFKGYWANPRSRNDPYTAAFLGMYEPPTDTEPRRGDQ
jgi:hypothetical protein